MVDRIGHGAADDAAASYRNEDTQDLHREIASLREAVRARDDFISTAAHELRNPMTPMLMTVQALRDAADSTPGIPDRIVTALVRLDRAVNHYIKRTTTLLDISRLAADTFRSERVQVDFAEIVRHVVEEATPQAEQAGSKLTMSLPERLVGLCDELALQQVVENLVSNAIKYGGGEPIGVSLEVARERVHLIVRDHGIGISRTDQDRIFAPFERAVTRRQQSGFGLGLWVVGRLVDAMDATIDVDSSPGRGSAFTVSVPWTPVLGAA